MLPGMALLDSLRMSGAASVSAAAWQDEVWALHKSSFQTLGLFRPTDQYFDIICASSCSHSVLQESHYYSNPHKLCDFPEENVQITQKSSRTTSQETLLSQFITNMMPRSKTLATRSGFYLTGFLKKATVSVCFFSKTVVTFPNTCPTSPFFTTGDSFIFPSSAHDELLVLVSEHAFYLNNQCFLLCVDAQVTFLGSGRPW